MIARRTPVRPGIRVRDSSFSPLLRACGPVYLRDVFPGARCSAVSHDNRTELAVCCAYVKTHTAGWTHLHYRLDSPGAMPISPRRSQDTRGNASPPVIASLNDLKAMHCPSPHPP